MAASNPSNPNTNNHQHQPPPPPPQQQQQQFDMQKLFLPTTSPSPPSSAAGPPQLLPSSSYPPPSGPGGPHLHNHPPFPFPYLPPHPHPSHFHYPPPHMDPSSPSPPPPTSHLNPTPNPNPNPAVYPAHTQRSLSFPTPPLQPSPSPPPPAGPTLSGPFDRSGAEIMALLRPTSSSPAPSPSSVPPELPPIIRMPSSAGAKQPRGRRIPAGDRAVGYDVDVRVTGEAQPQLEVTPITKYVSDPQLCLGRQIAVNKSYICYGLKQGNIRILNINTALRSLFRTQSQRVNDMAFFAEDVHLLASAGVDGRIMVWKISEGPDEEDKPQITGKTVVALRIVGEDEIKNPRVSWHCYKQEILVVGVGKSVLRIDTNKVGKVDTYTAEKPLQCSVDSLVDGVQLIGKHDGEVTDLSMCRWMTTHLVSASMDGTIKIWQDHKSSPLVVLRPYDGQPVYAATFLTAPTRPDHIILVTAGPQNREVKIWVSANEEGWLLPSDADSFSCIQTLELKSSAEQRPEEAFFNQVVALSQIGLLLLANARRNAIYAIHIDYGPNPAATRMDYISEFTVAMPILSLTGTSDTLHGQSVAQIYCVQTQAIQQYTLDLCQCLPPAVENLVSEKSEVADSSMDTSSVDVVALQRSPSYTESKPVASAPLRSDSDVAYGPPSPHPRRPLSDNTSIAGFDSGPPLADKASNQPIIEFSIDQHIDPVSSKFSDVPSLDGHLRDEEKRVAKEDSSSKSGNQIAFKHPTHLITPSEILMGTSSSETINVNENKSDTEKIIPDVVSKSGVGNGELEVKVVDEARSPPQEEVSLQRESRDHISENKEKNFCSQTSELGIEMARECSAISAETYIMDESRHTDDVASSDSYAQPSQVNEEEAHDYMKDISGKVSESANPSQSATPPSKGKKQKGKSVQVPGSSSPSSVFNSTDSSNENGAITTPIPEEAAFPQFMVMQEMMLNQILSSQKEMQKQMSNMVAVPVSKECRRLEAALGRNMEKAIKVNCDALWARLQEENAKNEKLLRERTQQISTLLTNFINKELTASLEKAIKKEIASIAPTVVRSLSPVIEKSISSTISESFQRGVGDKAVAQLEKSVNSKLETAVARQIQTQFQTSGKQALQEALKSGLEASVIPAFDRSCKAMFEQVDATFQKGMVEHTSAAHHHFESMHSPLALTLREAITSASSLTQTLSGELADNQRKLLALAAAGANSSGAANPLVMQLSNGPLANFHDKVETQMDPSQELNRLILERKFDEAFAFALQRSDVALVSWLCSQVDLQAILSLNPIPLSQGVVLSLLQQLGCDIGRDTGRKLSWMTEVASAVNPNDPMIAVHVRPIFEQVLHVLGHLRNTTSLSGPENSSIRVLMHVITSVLTGCK